MSRNFYCEIYLHLTWHTKGSLPLLTDDIEKYTHRFLTQYVVKTPGAYVHEVGGIETHVHMAVSIVPTTTISEFIGKLKGASSHEVNQHFGPGRKALEWQTGYGVVSFGKKDLEWVCEYIRHQRQHHERNTAFDRLERVGFVENEVENDDHV